MTLKEAHTCELVEELAKREAVELHTVEVSEEFAIMVNENKIDTQINQGPVKILIIWD